MLYIGVFGPFQVNFSKGCLYLFLHVDLHVFQHDLLKKCLFFLICIVFRSAVKNQLCLCGYVSGLSVQFH